MTSSIPSLTANRPTAEQLAQHRAWQAVRGRLLSSPMVAKPRQLIRSYVPPSVVLAPTPAPPIALPSYSERPVVARPELYDDSAVGMLPERGERLLPNARSGRDIARDVAKKYDIPLRYLLGVRRDRTNVHARQEAMWQISRETSLSLSQIGRLFDKDHTTVIHSIKRHEERMRAGQG